MYKSAFGKSIKKTQKKIVWSMVKMKMLASRNIGFEDFPDLKFH